MEFALRDSKRMRSSSPKNPIRLNKIPLLDSCKVGVFLWVATSSVRTHFILREAAPGPRPSLPFSHNGAFHLEHDGSSTFTSS